MLGSKGVTEDRCAYGRGNSSGRGVDGEADNASEGPDVAV